MTTPIRMSPWRTVARLVLTSRKVMSVRISWRITTARIGPKTPPRPPARLTPPRTTAATLSRVYGPGDRRPDAGAGRERQAGRARRTGPSGCRRGPSSGRPTRRSGTPPAGCCRSRRSTDPSRDRRSGIQTTATMTMRTTAAFGIHSLPSEPRTRSVSHFAEPPPGRREDEQRAARPHERHRQGDHDVRDAGEDDQAAVDRAEHEAEQEDADRRRRRRTPRDWPFMRTAATTLARAIIEPIERSIPPDDDHDRLGDGGQGKRQHRDREALDPGDAVARLDELREDEQDDEERQQPEGPRVALRRTRRGHRPDGVRAVSTVPDAALMVRSSGGTSLGTGLGRLPGRGHSLRDGLGQRPPRASARPT